MSDTKNEMKEINRRSFIRAASVSGGYIVLLAALLAWFLCPCNPKCFYVQNLFVLLGIFVSVVWIVLMIIIAKLHSAAYEYYIINPPEQQQNNNQNSTQDNNQEDTKKEGKK
ncbi:MAG: hypothetical protein II358_02720 [Tidjanibacter sp.]|nr:hypothetical protein [Tidjanibacter sp.]